jgi:hypothetical protein
VPRFEEMERVARSRTENLAAYPTYGVGKTLTGIVAVVELDEHTGRTETRRFSRRNATIGESAEKAFTDTAHLRGVGVPQGAPSLGQLKPVSLVCHAREPFGFSMS